MHKPEQLCFEFIRLDDERRALTDRALTSLNFAEYEFHRRRIDGLT